MTTENSTDREYEEGVAGTNKERKSDPLKEYSDKEAMTPAKINEHEPTAVKRDQNDQTITDKDKQVQIANKQMKNTENAV